MEEFNKKFNDLVNSLDKKIRPPNDAILIHYMEYFDGKIRYQLIDKDPTYLKDAQKKAIKIDKNMQTSGKSNILCITRGTSSNILRIRRRNQKFMNHQVNLLKNLMRGLSKYN